MRTSWRRREYDADFKLPRTRRGGYEVAIRTPSCPSAPEWRADLGLHRPGCLHHCTGAPGRRPNRPTAIFAASDEMAFGAILAARDFGLRVPGGLVGHRHRRPRLGAVFGLTTFDQDARGQGS